MDPVRNPYSPGAGTRPPALVGRDREIEAMDTTLQRLLLGRDGRSQMLTGLRGVGKTVLLNEFEQLAGARGYFHEHIEVTEDGALAPRLVPAFRKILLLMDAKRRVGDRARRALGVLKAFSLRLPDGPELHVEVDAVYGPADSGDLAADLAGLFVELGEVARDHDTGVLLTVDELHYVDFATLSALVVGLHRAAQLRLPITIAGAGLPSLATLTGEAKSYAERMFTFPEIGSLSDDEALEALETPAHDEGVAWEDGALAVVLERTRGYPYFLQEFGKAAWDVADGPSLDHRRRGPSQPAHRHRRARRRVLPGARRAHDGPRARLPAGDGRARCRPGAVGRGGRPAAADHQRPRAHSRQPHQTIALLLAPAGRHRLHRAPVRRVHETMDPDAPARVGAGLRCRPAMPVCLAANRGIAIRPLAPRNTPLA